MNQNVQQLNLIDFTNGNTHPFGNEQGREVFNKLKARIDLSPETSIFAISLNGIQMTDASFPRESVISIARMYRESKWFYLINVENLDILDNWDYAAKAKEQPLVFWDKEHYRLLGSTLTPSSEGLVDYVLTKGPVLVSQVAEELKISVQNASTRLKKLVNDGYILRKEAAAETGGIEYIYQTIK